MVDRADLGRINALYEEARVIVLALSNFENGGRITAMTVSPSAQPELPPSPPGVGMPPTPFAGMWVTVPTSSIEYPAQMVTAIRDALTQRRAAVIAELNSLGVTGVT